VRKAGVKSGLSALLPVNHHQIGSVMLVAIPTMPELSNLQIHHLIYLRALRVLCGIRKKPIQPQRARRGEKIRRPDSEMRAHSVA
jgi:hypothetical protein